MLPWSRIMKAHRGTLSTRRVRPRLVAKDRKVLLSTLRIWESKNRASPQALALLLGKKRLEPRLRAATVATAPASDR